MNQNKAFKKILLLIAVLVTATCLASMLFLSVGCTGRNGEDDQSGESGGELNGEQNGTQSGTQGGNGEQNGGGESEELVPDIQCGHKLNRYGYCGTCQMDMSFVTVSIGKDITLEYHITVHNPKLLDGKTLQVVINDGDHVEVITDLEPEKSGYVFKYHGIAPHQMAHRVDAALILVDGGTLTVVDDILNYTVKQNITELIAEHKDDAEIVQILSDILRYGAAAQLYQSYETEDLATDGVEGLLPARADVPEKSDMKLTAIEGVVSNTYFKGATVWFGSTTRLKVTVKTDDISKVTLKVNGGEDIKGEELIAGDEAGEYYYYTDDIGMAHFGDVYTFTVYDGGVEVESLEYSVNSYVYSKMNGENEKLSDLVLALYRAGLSAAGWVENHPDTASLYD